MHPRQPVVFRELLCCERRDNHLSLRFEPCFAARVVNNAASHTVQLCSVSSNEASLRMLNLFVKMSQAPGSWSAVRLLPPLMLAQSPLHHWEVLSHPCVDAEFHVVQRSAFWSFIGREPQCLLIPSQLGKACSRVGQGLASCRRLCQRLFPARLSLSQMPGFRRWRRSTLGLENPPLTAFPSRRSIDPFATIFPVRPWLLRRVPVFPSFVVRRHLPRWEQLPDIVTGRPSSLHL